MKKYIECIYIRLKRREPNPFFVSGCEKLGIEQAHIAADGRNVNGRGALINKPQ